MRHEEVKAFLWEIVAEFFQVPVIWQEQIVTQPKAPFVTIKLGDPTKNIFGSMRTDGSVEFRSNQATMEINLYTNGRKIQKEGAKLTNYINTAISDMEDFCDYIDSDHVSNVTGAKGVAIVSKDGSIRDLSELEKDTQYQFRAMCEFDVTYVRESDGKYGLLLMPEDTNPSGGGSEEMRTAPTYEIKNIDLSNEDKEVEADEE